MTGLFPGFGLGFFRGRPGFFGAAGVVIFGITGHSITGIFRSPAEDDLTDFIFCPELTAFAGPSQDVLFMGSRGIDRRADQRGDLQG
jgi:hypothetical protein